VINSKQQLMVDYRSDIKANGLVSQRRVIVLVISVRYGQGNGQTTLSDISQSRIFAFATSRANPDIDFNRVRSPLVSDQ
jgi:hypothetical protein